MAPLKIVNSEGEVADVYNPHESDEHYNERLRRQHEREQAIRRDAYVSGVLDVCLRLMISGAVVTATALIVFLIGNGAFTIGPLIAGLSVMLAGLLAGLAAMS